MKIFSLFVVLLITLNAHSQVDPVVQNHNISQEVRLYSTPNKVEGSNYLFKDWNNKNSIYFKDGKGKINSININVKYNAFETKISKDEVYVLDMTGVDFIMINHKKYKSFVFKNDGIERIFEIVAVSKDVQLLKGFEIFFRKGISNPLDTDPVDKYLIETRYFVKKNDNIFAFKLNKKQILVLFEDDKNEVMKFVKKEKLSYKKEKDIKKIFLFSNDL